MPKVMGSIEEGAGAFVQLRDSGGDFVGEVRADDEGRFTFHAIPGDWTIVCLTPARRRERRIDLGPEDVHVVIDLVDA